MSVTVQTWFLLNRSTVETDRKQYIASGWDADDAMTTAAEDALLRLRKTMPARWQDPNLRWQEAGQCIWFDVWDLGLPPADWARPILLAVAREVFGHYLTPNERRIRDQTVDLAMTKSNLWKAFEFIARAPSIAKHMELNRGRDHLLAILDLARADHGSPAWAAGSACPFLPITDDRAKPFGWPLIDLRFGLNDELALADRSGERDSVVVAIAISA